MGSVRRARYGIDAMERRNCTFRSVEDNICPIIRHNSMFSHQSSCPGGPGPRFAIVTDGTSDTRDVPIPVRDCTAGRNDTAVICPGTREPRFGFHGADRVRWWIAAVRAMCRARGRVDLLSTQRGSIWDSLRPGGTLQGGLARWIRIIDDRYRATNIRSAILPVARTE
jgi:hypothetical protein